MKETETVDAIKKIVVTRDAINELQSIEFDGVINVVDDEASLEYAFSKIEQAKQVGFDTESRPAFLKGQKFPVSIVQISLMDEAFIFRLSKTKMHDKLIALFASEDIEKVGIGVRDDIQKLQEMHSFKPANFTDLSDIAKKQNIMQTGARALTALFLGRRLVKSAQKTNWAKSILTSKQLCYAATDAWICLKILPELITNSYKIPLTYHEEKEA